MNERSDLPAKSIEAPRMRLPRLRFTVQGTLLGISVLALVGTVAIQQRRLNQAQPLIDLALNCASYQIETSEAARRDAALRSIFGDLGLVILRDGDKVEGLRVVKVLAKGPPEVVPTGRVLGRPFAQRLGKIVLDEAGFIGADCFAYPWVVGFRVWRRDESIEILYERYNGSSHVDIQVIVRDWRGDITHDSGFWRCISHRSLGELIGEIEAVGLKP